MKPGREVAFLRLGVIGFPMAGQLTRTAAKAEVFYRTHADLDVRRAETPADAVRQAEFVFACREPTPTWRRSPWAIRAPSPPCRGARSSWITRRHLPRSPVSWR